MPQTPGYVVEAPSGLKPIVGVETSLTVFVGTAYDGPVAEPTELTSGREYQHVFGATDGVLGLALSQYFVNGGGRAIVVRVPACNAGDLVAGLAKLDLIDYFGLLCIPETAVLSEADARDVAQAALAACRQRRAFYLVDAPLGLTRDTIVSWAHGLGGSSFGAVYFPPLRVAGPQAPDASHLVGPAASVAGIIVRTDQQRGVWKAPAGADARVNGALSLLIDLHDAESGLIGRQAVNTLRRFPVYDMVVWGARTLGGADTAADDYKYVPVRRLASFIEESILKATRATAFEPNDPRLWAALRLQLGAFLHTLFSQGAFQGASPRDAYFVRCDETTTTQADIDQGRLNILIGFAPVKPAEFLILRLQLRTAPTPLPN